MAVEERSRRQLQEALMEAIGPDQTDTLLTYLPPTGWADVATKPDLRALGAELRGELAELRGEFAELRGELRAMGATIRAELHHELRVQFFWMVTLQFASLAVLIALFGTTA